MYHFQFKSKVFNPVMIDWGPAMRRGRADSLDSQLMDELVFSNLIPIGAKARLSLLTGGTVAEAAAAAAESANMTTPRFSSPSVASFTTTDQQQQQHNISSNHRFLLPTAASAGGPIYPNNNNGIAKALLFSNSRSWCPFPATPPPLCALYGSSSSASSMCSHKSAATSNGGGAQAYNVFPFDRSIIYGPADQQMMAEELEEDRSGAMNIKLLNKATQSEGDGGGAGCKRCATFWSILEGKSSSSSRGGGGGGEEEKKTPKVIGKFVFANILEKRGQTSPNYGTMLLAGEDEASMQHNNSNRMGGAYSQGETLIMNERSFLI
uniref:Dof-type domain-containing protein n=1 Tax=Globodera pallida TaxID=36090 RepID=A0A183BLW4_GLOPA